MSHRDGDLGTLVIEAGEFEVREKGGKPMFILRVGLARLVAKTTVP